MLLGSILEDGAVYYPLLFGIPVAAGIVVAAMMLVDFALDEERWSDLPFFVVVGLILIGLAALARWITLRFRPEPVGRVAE